MCSITNTAHWLRAVHRFASRWRAYGRSVLARVVMFTCYPCFKICVTCALSCRVGLSLRSSSLTHRLVYSISRRQKKSPRNRLFSTFCVQHSKDLCQRCVTRAIDILPDLKDGDSSCETLMSERKNIQCWVYISIMERTALHALPFSYS